MINIIIPFIIIYLLINILYIGEIITISQTITRIKSYGIIYVYPSWNNKYRIQFLISDGSTTYLIKYTDDSDTIVGHFDTSTNIFKSVFCPVLYIFAKKLNKLMHIAYLENIIQINIDKKEVFEAFLPTYEFANKFEAKYKLAEDRLKRKSKIAKIIGNI